MYKYNTVNNIFLFFFPNYYGKYSCICIFVSINNCYLSRMSTKTNFVIRIEADTELDTLYQWFLCSKL